MTFASGHFLTAVNWVLPFDSCPLFDPVPIVDDTLHPTDRWQPYFVALSWQFERGRRSASPITSVEGFHFCAESHKTTEDLSVLQQRS